MNWRFYIAQPEFWILVLVAVMLTGVFFLVSWHHEHVIESKDWCTEAGGVPLIGDRGHFKLCLDTSAVIERPKE